MKIELLTLFPDMFAPVINESITGRAVASGKLSIKLIDIRDYTLDKHKKTDYPPFGGGAGMVIAPEPVFRAISDNTDKNAKFIYMSPRGRKIDQTFLKELSQEQNLVILCGHYEGVDQRIIDYWQFEEVSIGDYVLTGGELPAMILLDGVARLLPEVLGSEESNAEESFYHGLLEYPHYTRPRVYNGMEVPEILLSGNHEEIRKWRFSESLKLTKERRKDLFEKFDKESLNKADRKIFEAIASANKDLGKETDEEKN